MIILRTMRQISAWNILPSLLLFLTAILAAIIANSPMASVYQSFLLQEMRLCIGDFNLFSHDGHPMHMIDFINDGLMTIFFLAVGLEIKRELLVGELSSFRKASLPFIAACGGMLFPVVIYSLLVAPDSPGMRGMAIPMATDIAFSLGVLSLLGKRVPLSLKIFLTAFAVVDDIGGILVIAIFYSSEVAYGYLIIAAVLYCFLYYMGKMGMTQKIFFFFFGVLIWYLFLQSGIHSTISGVILAFVIPARPRLNAGKYIRRIRNRVSSFPVSESDNIVLTNEQIATLKQVERASDRVISLSQSMEDNLHGMVNFIILPLFAFANAGVALAGGGEVLGDVSIAVAVGLLLGKFTGIFSFTWLSIKSRLVPMPTGMNWKNITGVSLLGGIGFTVSLFIANLSFASNHPALLNQAKFGVLLGTVVAGTLGYIVLNAVLPKQKKCLFKESL
ncbi:Na+/H+ antiporter NhaA [Bacteroides sp. KG68]|uniref:Na+/H+ antiporter NhaA n=1 Tax=unclassified Bacteroides TaxID=2646097 RepID=UPI003D7F7424